MSNSIKNKIIKKELGNNCFQRPERIEPKGIVYHTGKNMENILDGVQGVVSKITKYVSIVICSTSLILNTVAFEITYKMLSKDYTKEQIEQRGFFGQEIKKENEKHYTLKNHSKTGREIAFMAYEKVSKL
ncbi:MAG: hypothetical protein ABIC91_08240 [Nanoarchaeota archaeon]|nr:hypothetical protein [Nanoarchaeota archaeon]